MSLESKARTYREIYALWKEAWKKTVDGVHNPLLEQKWVRLEDAQELEKQCIEINRAAIEILQKKQRLESRLEKLRKLVEEAPLFDFESSIEHSCPAEIYYHWQGYCRAYWNWRKTVEEVLKKDELETSRTI